MASRQIVRYPITEILNLLEKGERVLKVGKKVSVSVFAEAAGAGKKSTQLRDKLRDAAKYGIIRIVKSPPSFWEGEFELTELGYRLLHPLSHESGEKLMLELYQRIPIVRDILEEYSAPPTEEDIVRLLEAQGVSYPRASKLAKKVRKVLLHAFELRQKYAEITASTTAPKQIPEKREREEESTSEGGDKIVVKIPGIATIYVSNAATFKAAVDLMTHYLQAKEGAKSPNGEDAGESP